MTPLKKIFSETAVVSLIVLFCGVYFAVPPARATVDLAVDPAVAGMVMIYSHASTFVHRKSKGQVDLGFVRPSPNYELELSVRFALMITERRAAELIDMAADRRNSKKRRERALQALLRFEKSEDWLQPLLNELPKGGLLGLYEEKTPALDALFIRLRSEGGVKPPLIRDYAGLVFSFMQQVPDGILRSHAARWLPDILPEDALDMLVQRIPLEQKTDVRKAIEGALLQIRVIPQPEAAAATLVGFYKDLPWQSLRLPLAVVLARLGDKFAIVHLQQQLKLGGLTPEEKSAVTTALAGTPFPRQIDSAEREASAAKRANNRRVQAETVTLKRDKLVRQERLMQELLVKANDPAEPPYVGVRPDVSVPPTMPAMSEPLAPAPNPAVADAPETEGAFLEVADEEVPVYGSPSTDSGTVGKLTKGNIVQVLTSEKVAGERWFEISLAEEQTGWIRGDLNLRLAGTDETAK